MIFFMRSRKTVLVLFCWDPRAPKNASNTPACLKFPKRTFPLARWMIWATWTQKKHLSESGTTNLSTIFLWARHELCRMRPLVLSLCLRPVWRSSELRAAMKSANSPFSFRIPFGKKIRLAFGSTNPTRKLAQRFFSNAAITMSRSRPSRTSITMPTNELAELLTWHSLLND